jgi:hypothetical protein
VTTLHSPEELRNRRRSDRFKVRTPVVVRKQAANKRTVSENTEALVISVHGAMVLLAGDVTVGEFVTLENPTTKQDVLARVTNLGPKIMGKTEVGLEFIKPSPTFWGLIPAPKR